MLAPATRADFATRRYMWHSVRRLIDALANNTLSDLRTYIEEFIESGIYTCIFLVVRHRQR